MIFRIVDSIYQVSQKLATNYREYPSFTREKILILFIAYLGLFVFLPLFAVREFLFHGGSWQVYLSLGLMGWVGVCFAVLYTGRQIASFRLFAYVFSVLTVFSSAEDWGFLALGGSAIVISALLSSSVLEMSLVWLLALTGSACKLIFFQEIPEGNLRYEAILSEVLVYLSLFFTFAVLESWSRRFEFLYRSQEKEHLTQKQAWERQLQEQTRTLTETLRQLKASKITPSATEKVTALARVVAEMAHQVNTPLGAIAASNTNVRTLFPTLIEEILAYFPRFKAGWDTLLTELLESCETLDLSLSSAERRKVKKRTIAALTAAGYTEAEDRAEVLVELGIQDVRAHWKDQLDSPEGAKVLHIASLIVSVLRSVSIIDKATGKATDFIQMLRKLVHKENEEAPLIPMELVASLETTLDSLSWTEGHVVREIQGAPIIMGRPKDLSQVWTTMFNLLFSEPQLTLTVRSTAFEAQIDLTASSGEKSKKWNVATGLSWELVNKILHEHGGSIGVHPEKVGFVVHLPIMTQDSSSPSVQASQVST